MSVVERALTAPILKQVNGMVLYVIVVHLDAHDIDAKVTHVVAAQSPSRSISIDASGTVAAVFGRKNLHVPSGGM